MSFQLEQLMHKIAYATLVTDLSHVGCNWTRVDQDHLDVTCPQCLQTYTAYAEGSKLTVVLCQLTENFKTAINYRAQRPAAAYTNLRLTHRQINTTCANKQKVEKQKRHLQ